MVEQSGSGGGLGPLEAAVMAVLWAADGPMSVRDTERRLNAERAEPLAYTTVMTVLARLADKGILDRTRGPRRSYLYAPAVVDEADIAVRGVLAEFGDAAVARFVERVDLDAELRERLRRLITNPDREP